ncbi:MAG TPA: methyltransferase domain-containing protein, partial [Pseudolabrys sp.]|nr:methyltransferase domain-containing protein [Pseudolabrys sp.]
MSIPLSHLVTRIAYGARQLQRVGWYVGHSLAVRQLSEATRRQEGRKAWRRSRTDLPVPDRNQIYADMTALFLRDLANVEAGIYPMPVDHDGSLATLLRRSRLFFEDLPAIHQRRKRRANQEVLNEETRGKRPRYYLQNFHFQSGGWMTDDSAERYDTQVEVLFNGTANAIRRQALPQLREVFAGRDQRKLKLLDIGCGTGRFLDSVKQVWPRLPTLGLDMSEAYIRHARRELRRRACTRFIVGKAEAIPLPDNSQDAVTSIFLFHELPPKIRRRTLSECARVLKPGGRLILIDSVQRGDRPDYEGMLELFPQNYHEPYYQSYTNEDFGELGAACGLTYIKTVPAFVSKVIVFDKQAANG